MRGTRLAARRRLLLLLGITTSVISTPCLAGDFEPLQIRNQQPFAAVHGVPAAGSALTLDYAKNEMSVTLDLANDLSSTSKGGETVEIDGETYRGTVSYRRGYRSGLEWGVAIPIVGHSGGFLDSFIRNWHDFFGLPDLGRDDVADDRLSYQYSRGGEAEISVTDSDVGIGDVVIAAGYSPTYQRDKSAAHLSVRAQLKLPTGDSDNLRGSGAADLAVWVVGTGKVGKFKRTTWRWYGGGGMLVMGDADVLAKQQRDVGAFANAGVGWSPFARITFKLQFDAHTALYKNSKLNELADNAVLGTLGGTWEVSNNHALDFAVVEDVINHKAAPDITFHINWRIGF